MAGLVKEKESVSKAENDTNTPMQICFVCTGNTCRSPMAAAVTNAMTEAERATLPELLRGCVSPRLVAVSRGLYANAGEPISPLAVYALEAAEIAVVSKCDYHQHTAHTLSVEEAEQYDLLIGMTSAHAMELMLRYPQFASKITSMPQEISDPYGGDITVYQECLSEIIQGVRQLFFKEALE